MMKTDEFIRVATLGGPGLDCYAYNAAYICCDCAGSVIRKLAPEIAPTVDEIPCDSDELPQPVFFGESNCEESCDMCDQELPLSLIQSTEKL